MFIEAVGPNSYRKPFSRSVQGIIGPKLYEKPKIQHVSPDIRETGPISKFFLSMSVFFPLLFSLIFIF